MLEYSDVKPAIIGAEIILNVLLNTLVIAVILRYPELREDRNTLFILSLSIADLASGCTTMPISAAVCSRVTPFVLNDRRYLPKLWGLTSWWFGSVSVYSLFWANMSKAVAIITPFRSEYLLSRKRCYVIVAMTWIIAFLLASVHFNIDATMDTMMCSITYPRNNGLDIYFLFYFVIAAVIPRVLLIYCTVRIFNVVQRTKRQVAAQAQSVSTDGSGATNVYMITAQAIRSSVNIILLCVITLILTAPIFVYSIIHNGTDMDVDFGFYALRLFEINTIMNSLLYLVQFSAVRKKTCHMFLEMYVFIRGM